METKVKKIWKMFVPFPGGDFLRFREVIFWGDVSPGAHQRPGFPTRGAGCSGDVVVLVGQPCVHYFQHLEDAGTPLQIIMEHNHGVMEVWKIIFLSKWVICRFHVNLPGCIFFCVWVFFCRKVGVHQPMVLWLVTVRTGGVFFHEISGRWFSP